MPSMWKMSPILNPVSLISPKMSDNGASARQIKNCDPALSGWDDLAMDRMPLLWGIVPNSALRR